MLLSHGSLSTFNKENNSNYRSTTKNKKKKEKKKDSQTQNRKWQGHREEKYSVAFESQNFIKDKNIWFMST